jgi:hypothetical protein
VAGTGTVASARLTINLQDLHGLARDLRKIDPAMAREVRLGLRAAGQLAAEAAKEKAGYSEGIPPSIKVRVSGLAITVAAKDTPLAGLEEFGGDGTPAFWRHPVFGNREVWVAQKARPYLYPALKDKADLVEAAIAEAVNVALDVSLDI